MNTQLGFNSVTFPIRTPTPLHTTSHHLHQRILSHTNSHTNSHHFAPLGSPNWVIPHHGNQSFSLLRLQSHSPFAHPHHLTPLDSPDLCISHQHTPSHTIPHHLRHGNQTHFRCSDHQAHRLVSFQSLAHFQFLPSVPVSAHQLTPAHSLHIIPHQWIHLIRSSHQLAPLASRESSPFPLTNLYCHCLMVPFSAIVTVTHPHQ